MLLRCIFGKKGQKDGEHDPDNSQHVAPADLTLAGIVDVRFPAEGPDQGGVQTKGVDQEPGCHDEHCRGRKDQIRHVRLLTLNIHTYKRGKMHLNYFFLTVLWSRTGTRLRSW